MGARNAIKRLFIDKEVERMVTAKYISTRLQILPTLPSRIDKEDFGKLIAGIVQAYESLTKESVSIYELALQTAETILSGFTGGLAGGLEAATKGLNGGTVAILDAVHTALLQAEMENYFNYILREEMTQGEKCELDSSQRIKFVKDFFEYKGASFPEVFRNRRPEEFVNNYKDLIRKELHMDKIMSQEFGF